MPNQALFYPQIDIDDEEWIKTSLLYWDELGTIVPESIEVPYRNNSTQALHDMGILTPVRVQSEMAEIESLTDDVLKYLSTTEGARIIASHGHKSSVIYTEKLPYQMERFVDLYPGRLPNKIREELSDVFDDADNDEGVLRVDSGFAQFYMTLLASKLSERTGASLVTSDSMANDLAVAVHLDAQLGAEISNQFNLERPRRRWRREYRAFGERRTRPPVVAEGLLANLAISKMCILEDTSIDEILSFKESHSDELGLFHKSLNQLCEGIDEDLAVEALQEKVGTIYKNEVEPSVNNLKLAMDGKNIKWKAEGLIKLSLMSAGPSSALMVAGLSTPIALLAGAGISLTAMSVLHNNDKRMDLRNSPFAYLMSAEKTFS